MSPHHEIPLSGSFNCWSQGFELPDLLLAVCNTGQTGELKFMSSEAEKTIVLHEGEIVFAKSSSTDDRLGPYLLRENAIRFEHVTELSRFVTPEKRFGTVLVENGVLDPHELVKGVVGQVRSIVLSLFQWTEAAYIFEATELEKEAITLRIPLAKLILDGVRHVTSWRRVTGGIGSLDAVYQTRDGVEDAIRTAKLAEHENELVAEMRGPKTISEACAATEASDFEVCQLLWGFTSLGWLSPVTEQATATAPEATVEPTPMIDAQTEVSDLIAQAQVEPEPVVEAEVITEDDEPVEDLEGIGMILGKEDPLA